MPADTGQTTRGRPRSKEADQAIFDASWEILASVGYEGLSFALVADKAGCSRTTLYRRFSSKDELIEALLYETSRNLEPVLPADASPRDELIAHATAARNFFEGSKGTALLYLTLAAAGRPELEVVFQHNSAREREYYLQPLRRLASADCPEARSILAFQAIVGGIFHIVALNRQKMSDEDVARIVDAGISIVRA